MRTETLWQGERRAARLHWWHEVLDRPTNQTEWSEVFDEMVSLRFRVADEGPATGCGALAESRP